MALTCGALGADPLRDPRARDYAARDFKRYVKLERGLFQALCQA